ncbi:hypothetical protein FHX44_116231 [Pseudonocardia hierapolitana]|uniref:Uncharacterized protein n=1 Tax=Pseudonocardia hierapolitana TaxID=1128676 RepID=A0A561SZK3_9PSEU|nr:hypothetical protein [Pseudonocardia hierapolitana]TWF80288.1 hypothetical protein FHX44_116231 [Pseudonocardia hierapolitana]
MRSTTLPMLEPYPQPIDLDLGKLEATIDALVACGEAGTEKGQFAMFGAGDALTVSASGSQPTAEPGLESCSSAAGRSGTPWCSTDPS